MRDRTPASTRLPAIDPARCTGCGRCVAACAPHVLSLETRQWDKTAVLHESAGCTGCSECAVVCPFGAVRMRRPDPRSAAGAAGPTVNADRAAPR